MSRAERLIAICEKENADGYINPLGGQELYEKQYFSEHNINLSFIKTNRIEYQQFNNIFVPWLSIIDVMMFNSPKEIAVMLNNFELV